MPAALHRRTTAGWANPMGSPDRPCTGTQGAPELVLISAPWALVCPRRGRPPDVVEPDRVAFATPLDSAGDAVSAVALRRRSACAGGAREGARLPVGDDSLIVCVRLRLVECCCLRNPRFLTGHGCPVRKTPRTHLRRVRIPREVHRSERLATSAIRLPARIERPVPHPA